MDALRLKLNLSGWPGPGGWRQRPPIGLLIGNRQRVGEFERSTGSCVVAVVAAGQQAEKLADIGQDEHLVQNSKAQCSGGGSRAGFGERMLS